MTILRFIFHNWALKIGALLLAIMLYVGMVALQNTQISRAQVPIGIVHPPADSYMIKPRTLPYVTDIRYIAASDVGVSAASFQATIDLEGVVVDDSKSTLVRVQLAAEDPRVQIIDFEPQQVLITLDHVISKNVPVKVDTGAPPSGLSIGYQTLSVNQVQVTGAESLIAPVAAADARVPIDASGLDVDRDVQLIPIDASGAAVEDVTLSPATIHVRIQIGSQLRTQTVAIAPIVTGSPAAGYLISSIDVTPPLVAVSGEADALATLNGVVNTEPISLSGATGDVTAKIALALPTGVEAPDVATVSVVVHLKSPDATRSVTVGIVPQGALSDRIYTLDTLNVTVTLGGAAATLNVFDTSSLVGVVTLGDLAPGTYSLKVAISLPPGIKLVAVTPSSISVTVTLPPSPSPGPSPSGSPSAVP